MRDICVGRHAVQYNETCVKIVWQIVNVYISITIVVQFLKGFAVISQETCS